MEKKGSNQANQNSIQAKNNLSNRTNSAVRRLLASSALSTAIISWVATAQGLRIYVFSYYWQAAIISAAIQGTLFAFSVKAIPLMKKLRIKGKIAMGILWICILLSSSIFSYVYISKTVYSNKLLRDDSNRIMVAQYIEIYSFLNDVIELNKEKLETEMAGYITLLSKGDGNIEISQDDKNNINEIKNSINGKVAGDIIILLDKIKSGSYSENDVKTLKSLLLNEKNKQNKQIEGIQKQIESKESDIKGDEESLKTFKNINSSRYHDLVKQLESNREDRNKLQVSLKNLRSLIARLDECQIKIEYIENGLERKLYNETLELRKYLNQDKLNTNSLIEVVEKIYNDLFTYNISSSDPRLLRYKDFKNYVNQYALLVEKKEIISNDREKVYAIISENESTDEEDNGKENEKIDYGWEEISSNLQNILKDIPQAYFDEFILKSTNENQEYLSKNEIIELIMNTDRLYLSDLNDFERAWTLLRSDIHTYKTLLWFSVIFAFGMDLFSFGTGVLLYFMDNENEISINHKRIDWRKFIRKR